MRNNLVMNFLNIIYVLLLLTYILTWGLANPALSLMLLLIFPVYNIINIIMKYGSGETGVIRITKVSETERKIAMELNETPEDLERRGEVIFKIKTDSRT